MTLYTLYDADIPYDSDIPYDGLADQGAGSGRRKNSPADKWKHYREIGEEIAKSREEKRKKRQDAPISPAASARPPEHPPFKVRRMLRHPKLSDVKEIRDELAKIKFAIADEIFLQQEEDEAIFMLMMMAA